MLCLELFAVSKSIAVKFMISILNVNVSLTWAITADARTRGDLATEFFPLAQNENRKKKRTTYRKPAMSFSICYMMPFLFIINFHI